MTNKFTITITWNQRNVKGDLKIKELSRSIAVVDFSLAKDQRAFCEYLARTITDILIEGQTAYRDAHS